MRTSKYFLPTLKEIPSSAETASHRLMLRAGMIRKLGSGLYTWLPLGLRCVYKVSAIVHQEMRRIDALELLMPAIQPAELWQKTGRWEDFGHLLLKIQDRHQRNFCFGPTHEEVITDNLQGILRSYKQLPITFYQIQTKFRDEIRPRFGVMRAREFLMKDAYSFHEDTVSMEATYEAMYKAYTRIFTRLGLRFRAVLADTGNIGGNTSHEFQVLADSGEDQIAFSNQSDYAANIEKATALPPTGPRPTPTQALTVINTPGQYTIEALCQNQGISPDRTVKTLLVKHRNGGLLALILRGDHELNTVKAEKLEAVATPLSWATPEAIVNVLGCKPGSIGPIKLSLPMIVDRDAAQLADFFCGYNEDDKHYQHVHWERDLPLPEVADLRNVVAGDPSPDGQGELHITHGIEVGHIFQLGDKYSKAMGLTVLNEAGKAIAPLMGCYGLGVSRVIAAAIEQHHDEHGIRWPIAMAPFSVILIPINIHKSYRVRALAEQLYQQCQEAGLEVLLEDRKERSGVLFANADLIGIPHQVVIGERGLDRNVLEYKRRGDQHYQEYPTDQIVTFLCDQCKLTDEC